MLCAGGLPPAAMSFLTGVVGAACGQLFVFELAVSPYRCHAAPRHFGDITTQGEER
jgi:hypothetical protein